MHIGEPDHPVGVDDDDGGHRQLPAAGAELRPEVAPLGQRAGPGFGGRAEGDSEAAAQLASGVRCDREPEAVAVLDRGELVRDLRADRDQGGAEIGQRRVQLLLVVAERDIARRAAREAEEQQHHRADREQLVEVDGAAEHLRQPELLDDVARLHERVAVGGLLEQPPLVDVGGERRRRHRLHPVGVQLGQQAGDGGGWPVWHGAPCPRTRGSLIIYNIHRFGSV